MNLLSPGAAFFAVLFLGAAVQSATGFGMAIVAMSILPFFVPVKTAVVGMLPAAIVMFVVIIVRRQNHINGRLFLSVMPGIFIGRALGTWILTVLPDRQMRYILGGLMLILSLYFFRMRGRLKLPASPWVAGAAGFASGLGSGLSNIGGPPLVVYLFGACEEKREYQGTITAAFLVSGLYALGLHLYFGNINREVLELSLFGIAGTLAGTLIGLMIFHRTSKAVIAWFLILLTAYSGVSLVVF